MGIGTLRRHREMHARPSGAPAREPTVEELRAELAAERAKSSALESELAALKASAIVAPDAPPADETTTEAKKPGVARAPRFAK